MPEGTTIRAWIECPECCAKGPEFGEDALRDEFAGHALEGLLANPHVKPGLEFSAMAYELADNMMTSRRARKK